jgi:hypothetical protein
LTSSWHDGSSIGAISAARRRAVDLSLYWSGFPPSGRERFVAAYGPLDGVTMLRARVLALFLSPTLVSYARAQSMPALEAEALGGLERTL